MLMHLTRSLAIKEMIKQNYGQLLKEIAKNIQATYLATHLLVSSKFLRP